MGEPIDIKADPFTAMPSVSCAWPFEVEDFASFPDSKAQVAWFDARVDGERCRMRAVVSSSRDLPREDDPDDAEPEPPGHEDFELRANVRAEFAGEVAEGWGSQSLRVHWPPGRSDPGAAASRSMLVSALADAARELTQTPKWREMLAARAEGAEIDAELGPSAESRKPRRSI